MQGKFLTNFNCVAFLSLLCTIMLSDKYLHPNIGCNFSGRNLSSIHLEDLLHLKIAVNYEKLKF